MTRLKSLLPPNAGVVAVVCAMAFASGVRAQDAPVEHESEADPAPRTQPKHDASLNDQMRIMGRVLEKSIDRKGPDGWKRPFVGMSFFDSHIKAEYVPTVGVIFTVPVDVALKPSPDAPAERKDGRNTEDLWEESASHEKRVTLVAPDVDVNFDPEVIDEEAIERKTAEAIRRMELNFNEAVNAERLVNVRFFGDQRPYSEEDVASLKRAIVSALAKYGHRMTELPADERVLVIVEGPGRGGRAVGTAPKVPAAVDTPALGLLFNGQSAEERSVREDSEFKPKAPKTPKAPVEPDAVEDVELVAPKAPPARPQRAEAVRKRVERAYRDRENVIVDRGRLRAQFNEDRDRILISVQADALSGELTYDELAPVIREIAY